MQEIPDHSLLDPRVVELLGRPQPGQRTPEWYAARRELITASDCAAALGIKPFVSFKGDVRKELMAKKLDPFFMTNIYVEHGVVHEDEARDAAMEQLGLKCLDFGLLRHPEHRWLWASPDGVTYCGKCVEIKCPLRRKIVPGEVPHHYFPQVQIQMYVCGLDETIFIEYMPSKLTKGAPFVDIKWVKRDDSWLDENIPKLKVFFDEYEKKLLTHVPIQRPPPPACLIEEALYEDIA